MRIYIVGYMGSGKSTFGYNLAVAIGLQWVDLDSEFELRYRISIADFFTKYGESTFRKLEHNLLNEITLKTDIVVSTGGGTPCYNNNMQLMNQTGITLYLKTRPELLISRIENSPRKRPVFRKLKGEKLLENISKHLQERELYYNQATFVIDAANPDIPEIKSLISDYFKSLS